MFGGTPMAATLLGGQINRNADYTVVMTAEVLSEEAKMKKGDYMLANISPEVIGITSYMGPWAILKSFVELFKMPTMVLITLNGSMQAWLDFNEMITCTSTRVSKMILEIIHVVQITIVNFAKRFLKYCHGFKRAS